MAVRKSVMPVREVAVNHGMRLLTGSQLTGELGAVKKYADDRASGLSQSGKLKKLESQNPPTTLGLLPKYLKLFEQKPAQWAEKMFGVSTREQEWEMEVLPEAHADVAHFAQVYGTARLAGLDIYAGNGHSLLQLLFGPVLQQHHPHRDELSTMLPDAFHNRKAYSRTSAPVLLIDFASGKHEGRAQWAREEVGFHDVPNKTYGHASIAGPHDYLAQLFRLMQTDGYRLQNLRDDVASSLFLSPSVQGSLLAKLPDLERAITPVDVLDLPPPALTSAMLVSGHYPRPHGSDRFSFHSVDKNIGGLNGLYDTISSLIPFVVLPRDLAEAQYEFLRQVKRGDNGIGEYDPSLMTEGIPIGSTPSLWQQYVETTINNMIEIYPKSGIREWVLSPRGLNDPGFLTRLPHRYRGATERFLNQLARTDNG
jgi:hypothetical protein